jgi:phage baseplate assembly protein W
MDNLGVDLLVLPFLVADDAAQIDLASRASPLKANVLGVLQKSFPRVTAFAMNPTDLTDLALFSGRNNLAQALILRLLTPRGSLASLGHAAYGSRLAELIGQPKVPSTRALCRAYVLEVVAQEPRVEPTAVDLVFDPLQETASSFQFTLVVQPGAGGDPLSLSLEVAL